MDGWSKNDDLKQQFEAEGSPSRDIFRYPICTLVTKRAGHGRASLRTVMENISRTDAET